MIEQQIMTDYLYLGWVKLFWIADLDPLRDVVHTMAREVGNPLDDQIGEQCRK